MTNRKKLYLSLCRKKTNYFIFFVLASLSLLFLIILMIYQSADHTIQDIKNTYRSSFNLQVVPDRNNPDFFEQVEVLGRTYQIYCGPNVGFEMLDRVQAEIEEITGYEAGDLTGIILLWDYQLIEGYFHHSHLEKLKNPSPGYTYTAEETKNLQYLTNGFPVGNSENLKEFQNGSFALIEGRHINQNDTYKVIISKKLAEKNHLNVGDSFRIETSSLSRSGYPIYSLGGIDTQIVGLFQLTYEQAISYNTSEEDILENWIIVDQKTCDVLDTFYGDPDQLNVGHLYIENPDEMAEVMKKVRDLDWIDWKYFKVCEDDSRYSDAVKPLENMKLVLFWTVIISGVLAMVLISLLITHNAKKRRKEWGIFLAMGTSVKEIRSLVKKEYLIIALTAFLAAFFTSVLLAPAIANGIYKGMGGGNEVKEYTQEEIDAAIARGDNALAQQMSMDQRQLADNILPETLEVHLNVFTTLIVAVLELVVVLFFVTEALDSTLSRNPIDVLTMIR
ncbi:ABC transporter permease [Lachnospiraceae bacterium]|nr:ABC transporter permease [Lachnospiraceae bacterium]